MHTLSTITLMILAGGRGTRLRSMVADRPKVLAEVRGRPFLAYLLDQAASFGVSDVVLCTGYLGEQIQACLGDSYQQMRLVYSQESVPAGTAGALRLAMLLVASDTVLVMNGDSFCDADLAAFVVWHVQQSSSATVLLTKVPDTKRYGRVNVDADGRILRFEEKGEHGGPGWINAGIYLFRKNLLLNMPEQTPMSLERDIFPALISSGVYGYRTTGAFLDIGTPESYAEAERFFAEEFV